MSYKRLQCFLFISEDLIVHYCIAYESVFSTLHTLINGYKTSKRSDCMLLGIGVTVIVIGILLFVKLFNDKKKSGKFSNIKLALITLVIAGGIAMLGMVWSESVDSDIWVEQEITVIEKSNRVGIGSSNTLRGSKITFKRKYYVETKELGRIKVSSKNEYDQLIEGQTNIIQFSEKHNRVESVENAIVGTTKTRTIINP